MSVQAHTHDIFQTAPSIADDADTTALVAAMAGYADTLDDRDSEFAQHIASHVTYLAAHLQSGFSIMERELAAGNSNTLSPYAMKLATAAISHNLTFEIDDDVIGRLEAIRFMLHDGMVLVASKDAPRS